MKDGVKEEKKEKKYAAMDTNKDGKLDKSEWTAQGGDAQVFNKMDKNNDGAISTGERDTGRAAGTISPAVG